MTNMLNPAKPLLFIAELRATSSSLNCNSTAYLFTQLDIPSHSCRNK